MNVFSYILLVFNTNSTIISILTFFNNFGNIFKNEETCKLLLFYDTISNLPKKDFF